MHGFDSLGPWFPKDDVEGIATFKDFEPAGCSNAPNSDHAVPVS